MAESSMNASPRLYVLSSLGATLMAAVGGYAVVAQALGGLSGWQPGALAGGLVVGALTLAGLETTHRRLTARIGTLEADRRDTLAIVDATLAGAHAVAWGRRLSPGAPLSVSANVDAVFGRPASYWCSPAAWAQAVFPEDLSRAQAEYRAGLQAGGPFEVRYRMCHPDGRILHVRDRVALMHADDGALQLRGLIQDVTGEQETLARIRDSEARFRAIFEQASVGIALCSSRGVIESVNARLVEIVGRSAAELVGRHVNAVLSAHEHCQQCRACAGARMISRHCTRADGSDVWVQVALSPMANRHGRPEGLLAVVLDITHVHDTTQALVSDEQRLRSLMAALGEGVIMRDTAGQVILHNAAAARMFGLTDEQMSRSRLDHAPVRYLREDGAPYPVDELPPMRTLNDGDGHSGLLGIELDDGRIRWLWAHSKPVLDDAGETSAVVTSLADITRLRDAETRLRLADKAIDHSADAIMITTDSGLILRVNPAFTRVTGYTPEDVIGHTPALLRSGRHDTAFYATMWDELRSLGRWQGDIWNRHKDGSLFVERLSISAVRDPGGHVTHYVAVFSDVTEARNKERHFAHLAQHDALTGLPNRSLMADRLERALARAARNHSQVGLIYLDVDRFKRVNDTCGHGAGDALLREVARRLHSTVRDSDSVGRQAGDEFVLILPDLEDANQASQVAHKIFHAMAEPIDAEGHRMHTTVSIGIALYPSDAGDAETLINRADTALYHAKAGGRATFRYFTAAMNAEAEQRLRVEEALAQALAADALSLRFQPLYHLGSGRIVAMEALCRWDDPELGAIVPAEVIGETGDLALMVAIDTWLLRTGCQEAAQWQAQGSQTRLSVPLGKRHFRQHGLPGTVRTILDDTGLDPAQLELELPETMLNESDPSVSTILSDLKRMGVRLVVGQFGAGHTTLGRLKQFGIDRIKVDRSVVAGLDRSADLRAIMRAIVDLGRHMEVEVLADGLETETQRDQVIEAGCPFGQGSLLRLPVERHEALPLLGPA